MKSLEMKSSELRIMPHAKMHRSMRISTRYYTHAMSALFFLLIMAFPTLAIAQAPTGAPVLLAPEDGAEIIDTTRAVVLQWELVPQATTHEVQLFYTSDTTGEPIPLKTKVLTEDTHELLVSDLLALVNTAGSDGDSTFYWRVRGRNAQGEGEWNDPAWQFTIVSINQPPTWLNLPADGTEINELDEFASAVEANDAENDPITYSVNPEAEALGFMIDPATGAFSWTPIESQAGPASYAITFTATDGMSSVDSTITIIVNEVNLAPELAPIVAIDTIIVNQLHTFPVMATDADTIGLGDGQPFTFNTLTFSLDGASTGLGMAVNPGAANGEATFEWTPAEVGIFDITMNVNDGSTDDSQLFQLVVIPSTCPRLDQIADQTIVELNTLSLTFTASNECPAGTFTFDIDQASKDAGMSVDAGSGVFSWTPLESQAPALYTVIASISDGDSTNTQTFSITAAEENLAPELSLRSAADTAFVVTEIVSLVQGDVILPVTFQALATDDDTLAVNPVVKNNLVYSLTNRPVASMDIDPATGAFTWTPTSDIPDSTIYDVVVRVTDDGEPSAFDEATVSIVVRVITTIVTVDDIQTDAFCSAAPDFDLNWGAVAADGYTVQIATDAGFTSIVVDSIGTAGSTAKAPLASLEYDVIYYWRVRPEVSGGPENPWTDGNPFKRWEQNITVAHTLAYPKATESADFRMISIPGQSTGIPAASTFSGAKAPAGPLRANGDWDWSMWRDNATNIDYPNYLDQSISDAPFAPGVGFWAISTSAWQVSSQSIPNAPLTNDRFFGIPLNQGNSDNDLRWTMIGNPFDFPILWQDLIDENVLVESFDLWDWTGQQYENVTVMEPYKGYYYFNSKNDPTLNMPCVLTPVDVATKQDAPAKTVLASKTEAAGKTLVVSQHESSSSMSPALSSITVKTVEGAVAGFDRFDRVVPRPFFEKHRVTLVNEEMDMSYPYFIEEARDAAVDEQVFNIELKSIPGEPTYLNIAGLDNFTDQEVYLFDDELGRAYNLHEDAVVMLEPEQEVSKLRLLIGGKDFMAEQVDALIPKGFKLQQSYPNPFVEQTTIAYALPDPDYVSLEIYNVIGQRVRTLVHADQDAGYHQVAWDGMSDAGEPVASGLYLYVFRSSTHQATELLVRVR